MSEDITKKCPPPTALDSHTLEVYAEQCGKQVALEWVEDQTGVKIGSCYKEDTKDIPECVSQNYGITLNIVNEDGSINWDNVAHDSGAIGGICVCAATGIGGLAAPICGKIGGELADITVALAKAAYSIGSDILEFFFGSDGPKGTACYFKYTPVPPLAAAKYTAAFLKSQKTYGWFPKSELVGEVVPGTIIAPKYWSRLLLFRGMAAASAAIADDMSRKTGASLVQAIAALDPVAPKGWVELARPVMAPLNKTTSASEFTVDYVMNIGGLLSTVLQPNAIWTYSGETSKGQVIVPRWQKPESWAGVGDVESLWYSLMFVEACDYQTTVWTSVPDFAAALKTLQGLPPAQLFSTKKNGPEGRTAEQAYWLFSVPKGIDTLIRNADDATFKKLLELWKTSLQTGMDKKMTTLRTSRVSGGSSSSSTVATVATVGAGAAALWAILKALKVM